mmetsp:Transcript_29378/g.97242  ORF Transcript_29378/g.97242 Transcript_29378/m.97242 type:complete len:525 (+) Transcript_29378:657-2231(+)
MRRRRRRRLPRLSLLGVEISDRLAQLAQDLVVVLDFVQDDLLPLVLRAEQREAHDHVARSRVVAAHDVLDDLDVVLALGLREQVAREHLGEAPPEAVAERSPKRALLDFLLDLAIVAETKDVNESCALLLALARAAAPEALLEGAREVWAEPVVEQEGQRPRQVRDEAHAAEHVAEDLLVEALDLARDDGRIDAVELRPRVARPEQLRRARIRVDGRVGRDEVHRNRRQAVEPVAPVRRHLSQEGLDDGVREVAPNFPRQNRLGGRHDPEQLGRLLARRGLAEHLQQPLLDALVVGAVVARDLEVAAPAAVVGVVDDVDALDLQRVPVRPLEVRGVLEGELGDAGLRRLVALGGRVVRAHAGLDAVVHVVAAAVVREDELVLLARGRVLDVGRRFDAAPRGDGGRRPVARVVLDLGRRQVDALLHGVDELLGDARSRLVLGDGDAERHARDGHAVLLPERVHVARLLHRVAGRRDDEDLARDVDLAEDEVVRELVVADADGHVLRLHRRAEAHAAEHALDLEDG